MSKRKHSTAEALEKVLDGVDPADSEGDEVVLPVDSDSEWEQSSDEECSQSPPKIARLGVDLSLTEMAKDGTVWREEKLGPQCSLTPIDAYAADGEPTPTARSHITSRLESFMCLVTLEMLRRIQDSTIEHAKAEQADWFIDLPELMTFIAVVILRGLLKFPSLDDCWSEDFGQPRIIAMMSRNRFQSIMRHLRFDDMSTRRERAETDRFAAISELWESFVTNCIACFKPGRHITIDEQLFPTKTRCCFLHYIATKPDKFGIKFWVACDLKTKYICNAFPYLGKDTSRPTGERMSENVVMRLMEPFLDEGRNVTTDNFFTTLSLAKRLQSRRTTILGTVNLKCRELPPSAKLTDRDLYTTRVFSTTGATLTVYQGKPRKSVCILSSMHDVIKTNNTEKKKPNTITDYNSTKCGVDVMDQMVRDYTARRGTRRWPVAVFYNMIDMAALNAHVLYQACTGKKERRATFLMELAKELAQLHLAAKKAQQEPKFPEEFSIWSIKPSPSPGKRVKCQVKHACKENRSNKRCARCLRFTCGQCVKEVRWLCHDCVCLTD